MSRSVQSRHKDSRKKERRKYETQGIPEVGKTSKTEKGKPIKDVRLEGKNKGKHKKHKEEYNRLLKLYEREGLVD